MKPELAIARSAMAERAFTAGYHYLFFLFKCLIVFLGLLISPSYQKHKPSVRSSESVKGV